MNQPLHETTSGAANPEIGRRTALKGIAGSLAGLAGLTALNTAAKTKPGTGKNGKQTASKATNAGAKVVNPAAKQKAGKGSGALLRVEYKQTLNQIGPNTTAQVTAVCPTPGNSEKVQVLGGGFGANDQSVKVLSSTATPGGNRWDVVATTGDGAATVQSQVICGYFQK